MTHVPQIKVPATYMRGGTSKGVFFRLQDLPQAAQAPGAARDALLMRVIGSPDPYGKQIDGMGAATSSTSKTVILSRSTRPDHDIDYLFGQVSIDKPLATAAICLPRWVPSVSATGWSTLTAFHKTALQPCGSGRQILARLSSRTYRSPTERCRKRVTSNLTA